jgi:hypothetical protein
MAWRSGHDRGRFNGATANSPWMTSTIRTRLRIRTPLQWGHSEFAVDDVLPAARAAPRSRLQWGHSEFAVDDRSRRKLLYSRRFCTALRAGRQSGSLRTFLRNSVAEEVALGQGVPPREKGRCARMVDWDRLSKSLWPIRVGLPNPRLRLSRRCRERKSPRLDSPFPWPEQARPKRAGKVRQIGPVTEGLYRTPNIPVARRPPLSPGFV